jgi:uracil-DNA glycosylase
MPPLTPRQRAMLAEMGVRVWLPEDRAAEAARPAASAAEVTPETIADSAHLTPAKAANLSKNPEVSGQPSVPTASTPAVSAPAVASVAAAAQDWDALRAAVESCRACPLGAQRRHAVFGVGDVRARWLVVGEAPGEQEDAQGEPFVGPSGRLLDAMLRSIGLDRAASAEGERAAAESSAVPLFAPPQAVYIANAVKCRPPRNRNPSEAEMAQCAPFLARQIEWLQPQLILAVGRNAAQAVLGRTEPLGRLRGQVYRYGNIPVVVTFHPAYLLRSPAEKARAWEDLCLARSIVDGAGL